MHQLVDPTDVKKMYRKACLAVHPDKQMGTDNENLSKLIFMELNEVRITKKLPLELIINVSGMV